MSYYKCTDCHKSFELGQGTYDQEWGFHCTYCGGLDVYGVITSNDVKFAGIMFREGLA